MESLLTQNARNIIEKRYLREYKSGDPSEHRRETIAEWITRIVNAIAPSDINADTKKEYELMLNEMRFIPNTPCMINAGGGKTGQLAACFVLPISDDMGATETGIFATLRNAALIQQTVGGIGFDV